MEGFSSTINTSLNSKYPSLNHLSRLQLSQTLIIFTDSKTHSQMASIKFVNKHNMIACVEKNDRNTEFHEIINFITGCSVNYSLFVSPDLIQTWIQQFWHTAEELKIHDVVHIKAKVANKKILIS